MSKIIKIYCEGNSGSHDYDLLTHIIDGLPANVEIDPLGSIRGARAIVQYKENNIVKSDFKILFRDRDFDKPIPQHIILEQDERHTYCYYSYRNTIENYLFDPSLFFSFVQQNSLCEKYSLYIEADVKKVFIDSAERIKYYQAVRHTMGKMRTGETNFGTKLTIESGRLPERLDEEFCKHEAWSRIKNAKSVTDVWTEESFLLCYQHFIGMFNEDFMKNLHFLIYFQGKDFASSLRSILPEFPLRKYYKFAKKHFDYHNFLDLVQLRELIEMTLKRLTRSE